MSVIFEYKIPLQRLVGKVGNFCPLSIGTEKVNPDDIN
jgi:hypothetical protein